VRIVITLIITTLLFVTATVNAEDALHNHDPALVGDWFSSGNDGTLTELNFDRSGKFIFDQRDGSSIERTYMCGTWERRGESVELDVRAEKTRAANGHMNEASVKASRRCPHLRHLLAVL